MTIAAAHRASKVPEVTLVFWIIKIAATTLGETGGDTVTMTLDWGYLAGNGDILSLPVALILIQIAAREFHPRPDWATTIASTTAGTTMADFADRSLGSATPAVRRSYLPASWACLGSGTVARLDIGRCDHDAESGSLLLGERSQRRKRWERRSGIGRRTTPASDTSGALVLAAGLAALIAFYLLTKVSRVFLFWGGLHPVAAARSHTRRFSR